MGLVSGKIILLIIAIVLLLGWGIGANNGTVVWGNSHECFGGRGLQPVGDKLTWLHLGKLNLKYQPYSYDCDKDHQYSAKVYEVRNGQLELRASEPTQ